MTIRNCFKCGESLGEGHEWLDSPSFNGVKLYCDKCVKEEKKKEKKSK